MIDALDLEQRFSAVPEGYIDTEEAARRTGLSIAMVRLMCKRYRLRLTGRDKPTDSINLERAARESPEPRGDELACRWNGDRERADYFIEVAKLHQARVRPRVAAKNVPHALSFRGRILRALKTLKWQKVDLARAAEIRPETLSRLLHDPSRYPHQRVQQNIVRALNQRAAHPMFSHLHLHYDVDQFWPKQADTSKSG